MGDVLKFELYQDDPFGLRMYFLELIERELMACFDSMTLVDSLHSAVAHALFPAGKRMRPLLMLLACYDLEGPVDQLLPVAAALELLHCSSLVHDDLPALDNDDMRRGRPSCHLAHGEATALLAGDVLISAAFRYVAQAPWDSPVKHKIISELGCAFERLCSGQQLDLEASGTTPIERIYALKTGALFEAALSIAALATQTSGEVVELMRDCGRTMGVLFQVGDDLLDLYGTVAERGRVTSSDARNEKPTLVRTSDSAQLKQGLESLDNHFANRLVKLRELLPVKCRTLAGVLAVVDEVRARLGLVPEPT